MVLVYTSETERFCFNCSNCNLHMHPSAPSTGMLLCRYYAAPSYFFPSIAPSHLSAAPRPRHSLQLVVHLVEELAQLGDHLWEKMGGDVMMRCGRMC